MIDNKLTNLTTIETIITTGGTKYICLCGQHNIHYCSPKDTHKIISYAAEIVTKTDSIDECSRYCSKHHYNSYSYLEINSNYNYCDDGSDTLTAKGNDY